MNRKQRNTQKLLERQLLLEVYDPKFDTFLSLRGKRGTGYRVRRERARGHHA